jgi:hypothetical protein
MRISETLEGSRIVGAIGYELFRAKGHRMNAAAAAEIRGADRKVVEYLKSAVGAGTSDSWDAIDTRSRDAFIASGRHDVAFFRAASPGGARRLPFLTSVAVASLEASAWVRGKGSPAPLSSLALSGNMRLEPRLCSCLLVMTNSLFEGMKPEARSFVDEEMNGAIGAAIDPHFIQSLVDTSTPIFDSSGPDPDGVNADLMALIAVMPAVKGARYLMVLAADVAQAACLMRDDGGYMFPEMGINGGVIRGIEAIVSSGVNAGEAWLLNLADIAVAVGDLRISASHQADLEMMNSALVQDAADGTPTSLVNMFQVDSTALMMTIEFDAVKLRDTAIAGLTNIGWGMSS